MISFFKTLIAVLTAIAMFFTSGGGIRQLKNKGSILGYADTVSAQKELCDLYTDANGKFTILQFSDTHFTTGLSWGDITVLNKIEAQINEYKPDLAVISGDLIDDGDSGSYNKQYVLDTVAKLFEKYDQYWAYIPGNNDGLNYGTSADVTAYLSQYEHCLVADEKEISGGAQYSIDIRNADSKIVHSLIFLDTMDYDEEDDEHIYGYVHADQVEWCRNEIAAKQAENQDITVSVFIHENTPNFARAAVYGEEYSSDYPTLIESDEKYNIPKNQPLDDVFTQAGCVGLITMGHSHPDTCRCSYYNGTYYHVTPQAKLMSTYITINTTALNTRDMYEFEQVTLPAFS